MILLFIGGPKDGAREEVADYQIHVKCNSTGPIGAPKYLPGGKDNEESYIATSTYRRMKMAGADVMVNDTVSERQMIEILLKHYHPGVAYSGAWQRGLAPLMQGPQEPGVVVQIPSREIYRMQECGA